MLIPPLSGEDTGAEEAQESRLNPPQRLLTFLRDKAQQLEIVEKGREEVLVEQKGGP